MIKLHVKETQVYLAEAGLACLDCPLDEALDISPPLEGGADGGFAMGWDTSNIFIPEGCLSVILQSHKK